MLEDPVEEPPKALLTLLWERYGHWSGPVLRLGSYGWAYAAQFALTLVLGVEAFAVYVAATALGMLGAYGAMAGVTDLLTRQWGWLSARRSHLTSTLIRFVAPRLTLAFLAPAVLALALERAGLIQSSGVAWFWLLVGTFGLLSVTIDVAGVLLACLGRPSFHLITANGLLGLSFFAAAAWALMEGGRPDVVLFHVLAQLAALGIILTWLWRLMSRAVAENEASLATPPERPDLRMGVTVTSVHVLEILRNHLPILAIQAAFQNPVGAALVASLRFSRAADVMGVLAIAQYTRAFLAGEQSDFAVTRRRAQGLCMGLTTAAMLPIAGVVVVLCGREGLDPATTAFIATVVVGSGVLRQLTTIEIWIAKVLTDPAPALRIGVLVEISRFAVFGAMALWAGLGAAALALVAHDALLLAAMLKLGQKARRNA